MLLDVDIEKRFSNFSSHFKFSLSCDKGGVFGPSGSGKSTLMNMLAGLVVPDAGYIRLNNTPLYDSRDKINLPPERRKVGVVFQHSHLFPHMNVQENLYYGLKRRAPGTFTVDPEQLISVLQLEKVLDRNVTRLSGGEKQRVALGRTLLASPDLVLMDEPLSGLDSDLKFQIIPYLQKVFNEFSIPILFISHSLQEMRMMTDQVLVVSDGQIDKMYTSEELARIKAGTGGRGYTNLFQLDNPRDLGDLACYSWGENELMLVKTRELQSGQFSLNARDILLFKNHPEATSARNMLSCKILGTYETDWLVGVELECKGKRLIAEIVPQSVQELNIIEGGEIVAVIKASAFQRLY